MDARAHLRASLDRAFGGRSWHGPNLKGALRGLDADEAFFSPGPGRHSVYDLVLHAAYWKYVVRRRLTRERRGSFALKGSNFFPGPGARDARSLKEALSLLEKEHAALCDVVEALPDAALAVRHGRWTAEEMIAGVAAHDLYHAGQIQLVKKFFAERGRPGAVRAARTGPRSG